MNKTITANVGGFVFNIEEQAYETLSRYLRNVKLSMQNDEDLAEVMQDIEHRIAEIFHDILQRNKREVVNMQDVEEVIALMGEPEDFNINEEKKHTAENKNEKQYNSDNRQFFRDPDERVLGGVCSGLSAYFGWDPLFMRIIFILLAVGFGSGFIIYFILWMIIPEAKTTAEKLRMHGEKIDVESIKSKFKDIKRDMENLSSPETKQKIRENSRRVGLLFRELAENFYNVFGHALGLVLLIVGMVFLIWLVKSLLTSTFVLSVTESGIYTINLNEYGYLLFGSMTRSNLVFLSLLALLLIPVLGILMAGIRLIFKRKIRTKAVNAVFGILSSSATIILLIIGIQTGLDFAKSKHTKTIIPVELPGDTLVLKMNPDPYFDITFEDHHDSFLELIKMNDKKIIFGYPILDIIPTEDTVPSIVIEKSARGYNQSDAGERVKNITYITKSVGNEIYFDPYFTTSRGDFFRNQQCEISLRLPEGMTVFLSPEMDRIIYDIQNKGDMSDEDMVGHYWVMRNGNLVMYR